MEQEGNVTLQLFVMEYYRCTLFNHNEVKLNVFTVVYDKCNASLLDKSDPKFLIVVYM